MKYIMVTGGVLSGLGKGITASSIGRLLKARGLKVTAIKIDPYLNTDAGTLNPFEHGEVFVLDDGGEVDLDLGNYERFLDVSLTIDHNITTGRVYAAVLDKERTGEFLGKTVQIIPHITNEIKDRIRRVAERSGADVCIVELGGTVGDIESMPFLEAVRQLHMEVGDANCVFVHTTLVPVLSSVGEQKTKPTQHSVKELRSIGIQPHVIVARGEQPLEPAVKRKISLFCDVPLEAVVSAPDARSIYEVPLILDAQGLTDFLLRHMQLGPPDGGLVDWRGFVDRILNPSAEVTVCVVGKYTDLADAYLSHIEAFHHAGAEAGALVHLTWLEAEHIETAANQALLKSADAILIPGGFGERGIEGKIKAVQYAREHRIPFLGVCLGFQLATVEIARHLAGLERANSSEFDPDSPHPVVDLLPEQRGVTKKGATMRLGAHRVLLERNSVASALYGGAAEIFERHRHRYEINPAYIEQLQKVGWRFVGCSEDRRRMEVAELRDHPFFVASQFHPEFRSRPGKPAPLHLGLLRAALARKKAAGSGEAAEIPAPMPASA